MSRSLLGWRLHAPVIAVLLLAGSAPAQPNAAGIHDVVIYDPGLNDRGLPAVRLRDGRTIRVEMPPAIHVHRYYYSGDKTVQLGIISGGPTIVVARHPKTAKKLYVDVVLPAGTPEVAYKSRSITYYFPGLKKRVQIKFQGFPYNPDKVDIKHYNSRGTWRTVRDGQRKFKKHVARKTQASSLVQSVKDTAGQAKKIVGGAVTSVGELGSGSLDKLNSLLNVIPGVNYLRSLSDDAGARARQAQVREADRAKRASETRFEPTLR